MKLDSGFLALLALSATLKQVLGRELWLERDGKVVYLYPRRFGQDHPLALQKIRDACPSAVCGTLAGQAVTPLLAAQPECSQQDMADSIIDASKSFDATTAAAMVAAAIEYRQAEKNTPPDFTKNPPALRNSVFCQKAPKNSELNGLVQAQDPANNPDLFFDPASNETVLKGSQANTAPFDGTAPQSANASSIVTGIYDTVVASTVCPTAITVTVSASETLTPSGTAVPSMFGITTNFTAVPVVNDQGQTISPGITATAAPSSATMTAQATGVTSTSVISSSSIGDFGKCSIPQIEFGAGFDGRKETSFQPTNKTSFNHGSAQNINIITQFICDTLTNSCGADQTAKNTCAQGSSAASAASPGTGAQADAFNSAFGIQTKFASVTPLNDQGKSIDASSQPSATAVATSQTPAAPVVTSQVRTATSQAPTAGTVSYILHYFRLT